MPSDVPQTIGYACRYAPVAMLAGYGLGAVRLDAEVDDQSPADSVVHPTLCGYCKALACEALAGRIDGLLSTNCCDSMRRTHDAVDRYADLGFAHLVDLPRRASSCAVDLYAAQIERLADRLEELTGRAFDPVAAAAAVEGPADPLAGPHLVVLGARLEPALLTAIEKASPVPVRDLTCTGCTGIGPVPDEALASRSAWIAWYAQALLGQSACMRMVEGDDRRELALDPNVRGVIYHALKFCDFYSYDFQSVSEELDVPVTKLETDWTRGDSGQTATRIEALVEGMGLSLPASTAPRKEVTMDTKSYFAGIDSGSTSTDVVIIDADGTVVGRTVAPTGARAVESAAKALDQALRQAGITAQDLAGSISTGYGRANIEVDGDAVTEITCHARGAHELDPGCRTVIDIGGQDSKAIKLNPDGTVASFAMNDKCAAGTGRFLEAMARTLELDVDAMAQMGGDWREDIRLTTMCTVFAESEVVSLIAANKRTEDIVHGLNASVANKTASLVARVHGEPGFLMTGGVAQNAGVVAALSDKLGSPVKVPADPQACGALGAALIARDRALQ